MNPSASVGRRLAATVAVLVAGVVGAVLVSVPGAFGAYSATLTNSTDTIGTKYYFSCTGSVQGRAPSEQAWAAYPLSDAAGPTAADVSGNARPGTYPTSGVTYGVVGAGNPCANSGSTAVTLARTSGAVVSPQSVVNPQVFSLEFWFRAPVGSTGGMLAGLGSSNVPATTSTVFHDRQVYLTGAGQIVFGVNPLLGIKTVTSGPTVNYADNQWHQVVATLAASGATTGLRLYVDGVSPGTFATDTGTTSAGVLTLGTPTYWRFGYDSLVFWPNAPTTYQFAGSLAWASIYTYALTPTQVAQHYAIARET